MSQVNSTPNRRLSAALLSLDKVAYRHIESSKENSEFLKIQVVKGTAKVGGIDTVLCVDLANSEKSLHGFYVHASDLRSEAVVIKVSFITYGKGTIQHPVFARTSFTQDVVEFYVAVNNLTDAVTTLLKGKGNEFTRDSVLTNVYGKNANTRSAIVLDKLAALQNALKGGMPKLGETEKLRAFYDQRVGARDGKVTPYGNYLRDNGKREDAALKAWRENQIVLAAAAANKKVTSKAKV